MKDHEIITFIELVVNVLQTDYDTQAECRKIMEMLLNEADNLYIELTGNSIIKRGTTVIEHLVSPHNSSIRPPFKSK
jgi:hypothetical protein